MSGSANQGVTASWVLPVFRIREHLLGHDREHAGQGAEGRPFLLAVKDVVLAVVAQVRFGLCPPASQPTLGSERQKAESMSLARCAANASSVRRFRQHQALQPMDWWADTTVSSIASSLIPDSDPEQDLSA